MQEDAGGVLRIDTSHPAIREWNSRGWVVEVLRRPVRHHFAASSAVAMAGAAHKTARATAVEMATALAACM